MIDYSELYSEIDYEEDYVGCFYAYKSEANHRRYKNCRVDIFMKEVCGDIPHVYLVNYNGNICRVKLLTNEYLRDEKDGDHPYSLTKLEREAFNDNIHTVTPGNGGWNVWDIFISGWNDKWRMGHEGQEPTGLVKHVIGATPSYIDIKEPRDTK